MRIRVLGVDPSLTNMGMVAANVSVGDSETILPTTLKLVTTEKGDGKKVRKSSDNLHRAKKLHSEFQSMAKDVAVVFAEIPSGAQNANAAHALGIAVGIMASCPVDVIEVSPLEVKALFTSRRESVPKQVIMDWAYKQWPDADWITVKRGGKLQRTQANEHLADALAVIVAGMRTPAFQQLCSMYRNATTSTHNDGSAPGRSPRRRIQVGAL